MSNYFSRNRILCVCSLGALFAGVACRDTIQPVRGPVTGGLASRSVIPASSLSKEQLNMGGFERVALQIVRALQDPTLRHSLATALQDPSNQGLGIDLANCEGKATAGQLLRAGEQRGGGGGSAVALCADLRTRPGVILYMDPRQLKHWDGSTIPMVTGLAGLNRAVPPHLLAYRSPTMLMDIGADKRLSAPILVVVPAIHPSHWPTVTNLKPPGSK